MEKIELSIDELNEVAGGMIKIGTGTEPVHSDHDRPDLPGSRSAALRAVLPHRADRHQVLTALRQIDRRPLRWGGLFAPGTGYDFGCPRKPIAST